MKCDPNVDGYKRTNFKETDGDYTVWGSSKHFCPYKTLPGHGMEYDFL